MHDEEQPLPPANLLLVDDQRVNLTALEAVLAPLGHNIVKASSGQEALKQILTRDFAVVLLDVQMPDMDGFETAELIKEREKSRHIPIIFITAIHQEEKYAFRGYAAGAVDFMPKPFHPEILKAKVTVFIDLYQKNERLQRQAALLHESALREARLQQELREREIEGRHFAELTLRDQKQRTFLRDVLFNLTEGRLHLCDSPDDLPAPLPSYCDPVPLSAQTLRNLRRQVRAVSDEAAWVLERGQDFESAVGEASMNAVVHAGGGEARVHADLAKGLAQVWIRDSGAGIREESLHRATLERGYSSAGTLGHGFWMILKTADRLYLLTGPTGTTVVLEQEREPPQPVWLRAAEV